MKRSAWQDLLTKFGWEILGEIRKKDVHVVDAGVPFLLGWHSASAGVAFYNKKINFLKSPEIQKLKTYLDENYGVDNGTKWRYLEQTYLFIASKK
jgi:hypothetical protein